MKPPKYELVDIGSGVDAIKILDGRYSGIVFWTEKVSFATEPNPDGTLGIVFDILIHSVDDSNLTVGDLEGSQHFYAACAAIVADIIDDLIQKSPEAFLQLP